MQTVEEITYDTDVAADVEAIFPLRPVTPEELEAEFPMADYLAELRNGLAYTLRDGRIRPHWFRDWYWLRVALQSPAVWRPHQGAREQRPGRRRRPNRRTRRTASRGDPDDSEPEPPSELTAWRAGGARPSSAGVFRRPRMADIRAEGRP